MKRPKQVPSFVTAYSYEPLPDEPGSSLGSLYVVMEVLISGRASEEVADLIIETIGEQYYNHQDSSSNPLGLFEGAIKAANQALAEHVNHGNAAWIGKLSAVAAVQVGSELHVAQTGSAEAFLYRGKAVTHINASSQGRPSTPTKTFGSIASGQLESGDRLLLATPALIHQIPLGRLQSIISQSGPNNAIAELTDLLRGASTERIAALVVELTTPELAALQVRSEQPSEIQLGLPENALEAAKLAAAPIAQTTLASGKKVAGAAHTGWKRTKPHARAIGLAMASGLRRLLSTRKGRYIALAAIGLVLISLVGLVSYNNSNSAKAKAFAQYQGIYQEFTRAQSLLDNGNKDSARSSFDSVRGQLAKIAHQESTINQQLSRNALPENEPKTMKDLVILTNDRLDQIDGLVKAEPSTVTTLTAKNARPEHFEMINNKAYIFDAANGNALSIVNTLNGSSTASKINTNNLGDVVGTTISGNQDGIYIITGEPSVWFYRFDNDSLTKQSLSYGQWPKAAAIGAYGASIYLVGESTIYKHTKNATSFSPKSNYITAQNGDLKTASAITIDGSVYVASSTGLYTYAAGTLKESSPIPATLRPITNLRSTGSVIIGTNPTSKRIGVWSSKGSNAAFTKQIAVANISALRDTAYDPKTSSIYALADNRLIRITIKL